MAMGDVFREFSVDQTELRKVLAGNLEKLRTALGLTQISFANLTGVSEAAISNYLKAERLPKLEYLVNLTQIREIQAKRIYLTVDALLREDFDPQKTVARVDHPMDESRTQEIHGDVIGNYLAYFFDQSKPIRETGAVADRELRYGVFSVYPDQNAATGEAVLRVIAVFYKEEERGKAVELKAQLDRQFASSAKLSHVLDYIQGLLDADSGIYTGTLTSDEYHAFINIRSDVYRDNALLILYLPQKKADKEYIGGIGSIASVSHGRDHMPSAQKMILSKIDIHCSKEEIASYLTMSSAPVEQSEEAVLLAELCVKLFDPSHTAMALLDEKDKTAIVENRLNQLVRNYIEKHACSVGNVSEEEDERVYDWIQSFARKEG